MKGWLYVHTPEEYQKWADENLAPNRSKYIQTFRLISSEAT